MNQYVVISQPDNNWGLYFAGAVKSAPVTAAKDCLLKSPLSHDTMKQTLQEMNTMRLNKIQDFMNRANMPFQYSEEDDCGSINFIHRGLSYHIWEYPAPERGAQSNVLNCGRSVDYEEDYEGQIIAIMAGW